MKKIRELNTATPGIAEYLKFVGANANWEEFRSHNSGAAQRELRDALIQNQHELCAYCEINLTETDRQIEHVIPRSDAELGKANALDIANMIACCLGGPRKREESTCGHAKGNQNDENFIDPRLLPARPSLTKVLVNGEIEVDEKACKSEGIPVSHVRRTIEILNLNAKRLQLARAKQWNDLEEEAEQLDGLDDPDKMKAWIHDVLIPDENGQLTPFFTTNRSYFDPISESILAQQPQTWI